MCKLFCGLLSREIVFYLIFIHKEKDFFFLRIIFYIYIAKEYYKLAERSAFFDYERYFRSREPTIKSARKIPGKIRPKDSRTAESRVTVIRIFCRNPWINLRRLQKRHRQHRFVDGKIRPLLTIYLP